MATRSKKRTHFSETAKKPRHLRAVPGGKEHKQSAISELLSGKVSKAAKPKRRRKDEVPPQDFPKNMQPLANLFAAGRTIEKEMKFKIDYAKQSLDDFCLKDWIGRFVATNRRPSSIDYVANHSRLKFVLTSRTTLTHEKVEELRSLGLKIDEHTTLSDLQINYAAIKQHKLENKLRDALESMHVSEGILEEIFIPKVELKDTFYDILVELVRQSLQSGENLEEKTLDVLRVLEPAEQMRNVEVSDLSIKQCFDLIEKTEIEPEEDIA
jgi:hypothetical protein